MSFISILHQTTTVIVFASVSTNCLLSLFYIKPQPLPGSPSVGSDCLLSLFYIKPQRTGEAVAACHHCLLSLFYIKPQHDGQSVKSYRNCLLSLFYIKPQLESLPTEYTSIVFYLYSTSNHNPSAMRRAPRALSFISILHQTTTSECSGCTAPPLSFISILHQTTTLGLCGS